MPGKLVNISFGILSSLFQALQNTGLNSCRYCIGFDLVLLFQGTPCPSSVRRRDSVMVLFFLHTFYRLKRTDRTLLSFQTQSDELDLTHVQPIINLTHSEQNRCMKIFWTFGRLREVLLTVRMYNRLSVQMWQRFFCLLKKKGLFIVEIALSLSS